LEESNCAGFIGDHEFDFHENRNALLDVPSHLIAPPEGYQICRRERPVVTAFVGSAARNVLDRSRFIEQHVHHGDLDMGPDEVLRGMLMYFVLPMWLAAGFADYLCHRASHIEKTSGWKESVLHLAQFAEMAVPVLAALFLEITSSVILLMMVFLVFHEATAIWDVRYASSRREVSPTEQHVHSVLEMLPLTGLLLVIALHWSAFAALFGYGTPDFAFRLKQSPLPLTYIVTMLALTALLEVLPYFEELVRGLRYRPRQAKD
jgi:hypothetical protein